MTSRRFPRRLSTLLLLLAASEVAAQTRPLPGADVFAPLGGPYAVGVREILWTDPARPEPFTRDTTDRRRLIVRIWYPSGPSTGEPAPWAERALYIAGLTEYGDAERQSALPYSLLKPHGMRVRSQARADAPPAPGTERFPVIVYQPGGGQPRFSATFLTEQLASHGYVVVSADHPGLSPTVAFPDGTLFRPDTLLPPQPTADREAYARAVNEYLERDVFPTWTADAAMLLDGIERLDRSQDFAGRLDLERIGMVGWSFGGATSLQMSRDDPRVKVAVNHDGDLFGEVAETGTPRPVLLIHNGANGFDRFLARSTAGRYEVAITGATHAHFSDLLLFSLNPVSPDPYRVHEIVVAYTLAFLDRHLRGRGGALLGQTAPPFPEATLRSW